MTAGIDSKGVARPRVDWMRPVDDPIMENLRDHGHLPPAAFEALDVCASGTASNRLPALRQHGLVELYLGVRALYTLTEKGHAYLDEELDASELEPVDEAE